MKNLVIVESPTKAKTISKFLDKNFVIRSSYGHLRDLPKSQMGVDIEHNFQPHYVIPVKSKKIVAELKKLAAKAQDIYFATDEDREGEAISWHLQEIFGISDAKVKRITFHEITKQAILAALKAPHSINKALVDAQQARRVLDRLVGYELSPFLWKKVARGLSAGRVQSVAVRLIVEREEEIKAFQSQEYWTVDGQAKQQDVSFDISLAKENGKSLKKFDLTKDSSGEAVTAIKKTTLKVQSVISKEVSKKAPAPFTTSTLQQEANRRLGFSAKQTMMLAQQLYEGVELGAEGSTGLITYMRTDSLNLATEFTSQTAAYLKETLGADYALSQPRHFKKTSKLAQEAHEAIRPTSAERAPDSISQFLTSQQLKLYQLIWSRALASQMPEAKQAVTSVDIEAVSTPYILRATGSVIKFPGWQKIYGTSSGEKILPDLKAGDQPKLVSLTNEQHFTQPPARYSEAGLVHALEERGIGRPSTYAPTIATIVDRKYVTKDQGRLGPTDIGILVTNLLKEHFADIVNYDFTAGLEDDLDKIADGKKDWQPVIASFYKPFKANLMTKEKELSKKELTEEKTDEICEKCGKPMVIKVGRFGKFLACTGYPDCKNTKQLSNGQVEQPETTDEKCDKCGRPMVYKHGRYGKFLACSGYPDCKNIKNQQVSTGVKCPKCQQGEIVQKKSRRGKLFYSCNRYPACDFALWEKPTGDLCPDCKSLLVQTKNGQVKCSNKDCGYKN